MNTTKNSTYLSVPARTITQHHDKNSTGHRTVFIIWHAQASEHHGNWAAGTITKKRIKGEGRKVETFEDTHAVQASDIPADIRTRLGL